MTTGLLAGVDVGGSKIAVRVTDGDLRMVGRLVVATAVGDPQAAVGQVADAIHTTLRAADRRPADLEAIGVGVPGRVDPEAGVVTLAVNLGWHGLALGPELGRRFGVPVAIENDVKAAAAGLFARGLAGGASDLAYLGIGTGISAGVVLDGRLHRGPRGLAGEVGHLVVTEDGPMCACGLRGCLEAVASGRGIAAIAEAEVAAGTPTALAPASTPASRTRRPVSAADVYAAAATGDPLAMRIVADAGRAIARAIHGLVMSYDVRSVVLGGGVTGAGEAFLAPVTAGLDLLRAASALAREALTHDIVHLLPPDADAGAWGAVVLARDAALPARVTAALAPATGRPVAAAEVRSP
jgi:glucokinase